MWIFKSALQDFLKIYLPSLLGLMLIFFSEKEDTNIIFYFFIFHIVDVGHVYSTMLRTILSKSELLREPLTIGVPIAIALLSFLWLFFKIPYYWTFVVYFTVFHNLRQGWGLVRWYEKLNNSFHNNAIFYYIFTIVPFILFHLRDVQINLLYYSQTDYLDLSFLKLNVTISSLNNLMIHNLFFKIFMLIYVIAIVVWIFKEIVFFIKNNIFEYNRLLCMLYFISVYAYSFLYATSSMQIFTILILSHGIPYIFIMEKFLTNKKYSSVRLFLFLIVIFGALLNLGLEDFYLESIFNYTVVEVNFWEYLFTLIYISPILSHFVWDMYLWKRNHPDSDTVYTNI